MPVSDFLQRFPLFRLIVAYIIGIISADVCCDRLPALLSFVPYVALGVLVLLIGSGFLHRFRPFEYVGGGSALLFFVTLGMMSYEGARARIDKDWTPAYTWYEAVVDDYPQQRARSQRCMLRVNSVRDSLGWKAVDREVYAYMQNDSSVASLEAGEVILFRGRVQRPTNFSDSLTFDYARSLLLKGISGTVYLPADAWHRVSGGDPTWLQHARRVRHRLQEDFLRDTFTEETYGVLSALTLGDQRHIDASLRDTYSRAGASHVLALSGMHVGILMMLLSFLLRIILPGRIFYGLRQLLIIGILWAFAFLVGLSPSVLRVVVMCTLYAVARWVSRDSNSVSILLLTAFVMLLYDPLYLFDVGFQLSFASMMAILLIVPMFEDFLSQRHYHPLISYGLGILVVSVAAQLGTFPLVLHYFHTFPTYFLLTNLLVLPLLYVVLIVLAIWWVFVSCHLPGEMVMTTVVQKMIDFMNSCLEGIASLPGSVCTIASFDWVEVVLIYLTVVCLFLFAQRRWARGLAEAVVFLVALFVWHVFA